ncbi:MAG: hypothetical protein ABFC84_14960 [Veillonellales bacterium]
MARKIKKMPGRPLALNGEERKEKQDERLARYYKEHQQNQAAEQELSKLSHFVYEPVDYELLLVRKVRPEPPVPDFSYLLTEAQLKISNQYFQPIAMHLGVLVAIVLVSLLNLKEYSLVLAVVGVICVCYSFQRLLKNREQSMTKALMVARNEINTKLQEFKETNQREKDQFEKEEDDRINKLQELLNGERSAVIRKMEEVLSGMRFPFLCQCTTHLYDLENPVIFIALPPVSIIPTTVSDIIASGEVEYEDKAPVSINKQYAEVVTGIGVQIALAIHASLPTLNSLFLCGFSPAEQDNEFFYSVTVPKEAAAEAAQYHSAMQYLNKLGVQMKLTSNLEFTPVKPDFPEWWDNVRLTQVHSFDSVCINTALNGALFRTGISSDV